jgi:hypothetical protein
MSGFPFTKMRSTPSSVIALSKEAFRRPLEFSMSGSIAEITLLASLPLRWCLDFIFMITGYPDRFKYATCNLDFEAFCGYQWWREV